MNRRNRRAQHARVAEGAEATESRVTDGVRYLGFVIVGAFGVGLAYLVTQSGSVAKQVALGFVIAMAFLIHFFGYKAWAGDRLAAWQASLARVPLRLVGYGAKGRRPITAARGAPEARTALLFSGALSVLVIAVLAVFVL